MLPGSNESPRGGVPPEAQVVMRDVDEGSEPVAIPNSKIWATQRYWYEQSALRAWKNRRLPIFIANNSFLAAQYARLVVAFASDALAASRSGQDNPALVKINIVEIGAGHGKLGFLVLRRLLELKEYWPTGAEFRYILTDITKRNVDFWKSHPDLQEFFKAGLCDYATFDPENDKEIYLEIAGTTLQRQNLRSPMVFVCNYVFSSLEHDSFFIPSKDSARDAGILQRWHITAKVPVATPFQDMRWHVEGRAEEQVSAPLSFDGAQFQSSLQAADPNIFANTNATLSRLLEEYAQNGNDLSPSLPIGGLRCLRSISKLSRGKTLILVADKGFSSMSEFAGKRQPHIAVHGSISFMVNFHACESFVKNAGGFVLKTPHLSNSFKVEAYVLGDVRGHFRKLCRRWQAAMTSFDPDTFTTYQRLMCEENSTPDLKACLALVRKSHWDSDVFYRLRRALIASSPSVSDRQREDIVADVGKIWNNNYLLDTTKDVPFELGRMMMGLCKHKLGISFFEKSNSLYGEHHVTWYNIGICEFYLRNYEKAISIFDKVSDKVWFRP